MAMSKVSLRLTVEGLVTMFQFKVVNSYGCRRTPSEERVGMSLVRNASFRH